MVNYEMEYLVPNKYSSLQEQIRFHTFPAENDEEAVTKAKELFLGLAENKKIPKYSSLIRVYRAHKNLLDKVYDLSTEGKFSLVER